MPTKGLENYGGGGDLIFRISPSVSLSVSCSLSPPKIWRIQRSIWFVRSPIVTYIFDDLKPLLGLTKLDSKYHCQAWRFKKKKNLGFLTHLLIVMGTVNVPCTMYTASTVRATLLRFTFTMNAVQRVPLYYSYCCSKYSTHNTCLHWPCTLF